MRDGVITLNGPVKDFTKEMLVKGLLPPNIEEQEKTCVVTCKKLDYENLKPVFELRDYSGYGFSNINLKVYPGEILGMAGVVGAGRTELATTIFGREKVLGGRAILDGKDITGLSTKEVLEAGVNYLPEDRHLYGLFKISGVAANTTSAVLAKKEIGRFFLNKRKEHEFTQKYVEDFRIKITDQNQMAGSLSGGNQQKIVLGRSLSTLPKLVILDEPTRGIDAAARGDVYTIIYRLKDMGVAVLLISSHMEEIVELSDRAVTLYQGRINAEFARDEITQDNLMAAAFGVTERKQVVQ
jgi:AI-2 transport system ATP-binding protein